MTKMKKKPRCPVCGSKKASCLSLESATKDGGCPELERARDRAPPRENLIKKIHEAMKAFDVAYDVWKSQGGKPPFLPPSEPGKLAQEYEDLQDAAMKAFAEMNGWKRTKEGFRLEKIGHARGDDDYFYMHGGEDFYMLLDHCGGFQEDGKYVALLTQPYDHVTRKDWQRWEAKHPEFEVHVPPDPRASIYYPGFALFLVITARGQQVRWLPEQDGSLKHLWTRAKEEKK
jgi:hypothetical protein